MIGRARSLVLAGQLDLAIDAYLAGEQFGSNEEEQSQSLFWAAVTANDAKRFEQAEGLYRKVAERYGKSALGPEAREGVTLKIDIDRALIDFSYSADGSTFTTLLDDADARVLTTAVASGFTGAVVGPYAHKAGVP